MLSVFIILNKGEERLKGFKEEAFKDDNGVRGGLESGVGIGIFWKPLIGKFHG